METKTCAKCGEVLPLDSFGKNSRYVDGRQSYCKPCFAAYMRDKRNPGWREVEADRMSLAASGMRRCRVCGQVFPGTTDYFYASSGCDRGIQWSCKSCYGRRVRHRVVNGDARRIYDEWRSAGCVVCGCSHLPMIAAHHKRAGTKERKFEMASSAETVATELKKCVPVCMNHHAAIHYELRNGGKDLPFNDLIALVREKYTT